MTLEEAVRNRRSVRGFLDKPVPKETIRKAFELAQLSPSNSNIQPWRVFVASGATRDTIREQLLESFRAGKELITDFDYPERFEEVFRERQVKCGVSMYKQMGIARDDKEGRLNARMRNFEFFDASHAVFLHEHLLPPVGRGRPGHLCADPDAVVDSPGGQLMCCGIPAQLEQYCQGSVRNS